MQAKPTVNSNLLKNNLEQFFQNNLSISKFLGDGKRIQNELDLFGKSSETLSQFKKQQSNYLKKLLNENDLMRNKMKNLFILINKRKDKKIEIDFDSKCIKNQKLKKMFRHTLKSVFEDLCSDFSQDFHKDQSEIDLGKMDGNYSEL